MTVDFVLNGSKFVALNGGPEFTFNESISFLVPCEDQAEVDRYWTALTDGGGEESMCGWLKDRYGVSWQIVPTRFEELLSSSDPAQAERVTQALFQMKKIVIADLEAAAAALATSQGGPAVTLWRALRETADRLRSACAELVQSASTYLKESNGSRRFRTDQPTLVATRRQLHGIAECLLAGPEYQATGEIALQVTPGGFGTTAGPELRLDGLELVAGDRRVPAAGSFGDLADRLGVEFGAPTIGYRDGSGAQRDDIVDLDLAAAGSSLTGTRSAMPRCGCSIRASSRSCGQSTSTWRSCWMIARTGPRPEMTSIRLRTPTSVHTIMMAGPSGTRRSARCGMPVSSRRSRTGGFLARGPSIAASRAYDRPRLSECEPQRYSESPKGSTVTIDLESISSPARVASPEEGISADELQLAARNHGMPLGVLALGHHPTRPALPADPLRHTRDRSDHL